MGLGTLRVLSVSSRRGLQFKAMSSRGRTAPLCWCGGLLLCFCEPSRTLQSRQALQEGFQALEGRLSDRKLTG